MFLERLLMFFALQLLKDRGFAYARGHLITPWLTLEFPECHERLLTSAFHVEFDDFEDLVRKYAADVLGRHDEARLFREFLRLQVRPTWNASRQEFRDRPYMLIPIVHIIGPIFFIFIVWVHHLQVPYVHLLPGSSILLLRCFLPFALAVLAISVGKSIVVDF